MKRTAFSLVELLVVIAIIALLVAITTTALHKCRQHAKAVDCASNISQLSEALLVYESTHGSFPYGIDDVTNRRPASGYPGTSSRDKMGWWWFNNLIEYDRRSKGLGTPVLCPAKQLDDPKLDRYLLVSNYGINRSICKSPDDFMVYRQTGFVGKSLGIADIGRPGETLLLCDSGYAVITWMHAADVPPVKLGSRIEDMAYIPGLKINEQRFLAGTIWPGQERDAIRGRHPNKTINVGYVDGHVSRVKAEEVFVDEDNGTYKNRSPLWVPNEN